MPSLPNRDKWEFVCPSRISGPYLIYFLRWKHSKEKQQHVPLSYPALTNRNIWEFAGPSRISGQFLANFLRLKHGKQQQEPVLFFLPCSHSLIEINGNLLAQGDFLPTRKYIGGGHGSYNRWWLGTHCEDIDCNKLFDLWKAFAFTATKRYLDR